MPGHIRGTRDGLSFSLAKGARLIQGGGACEIDPEDSVSDIVQVFKSVSNRCEWMMVPGGSGEEVQASLRLRDRVLTLEIQWPDHRFLRAEHLFQLLASSPKCRYEILFQIPVLRRRPSTPEDQTPTYGDVMAGVQCNLEPHTALPGMSIYFTD
jgi:hypothetical protein